MVRIEKEMQRKEDMLTLSIEHTEKTLSQSFGKHLNELELMVVSQKARVEEVEENAISIVKEVNAKL